MSHEKAAEIIDLSTSRDAAQGQSRFEKAGEFLASARLAAGLGLEAISAETKVKIEHLEAIEQTRPDKLPATPYAVGFVKVYARFLDLDADAVATQFKTDIGAAATALVELAPAPTAPQTAPEIGEGVKMVSVFGIIAVLIFAGWVAAGILGNKDAAVLEYQSAPELIARPTAVLTQVSETEQALAPRVDAVLSKANAAPQPTVAEATETDITEAPAVADAPVVALETTSEIGPEERRSATSIDTLPVDASSVAGSVAALNAQARSPEAITEFAPVELAAMAEQQEIQVAPQVILPQATPSLQGSVIQEPVFPELVVITSKLTRSTAPNYPDRCGRDAAAVESVTVIFDVTVAGRAANARVSSSTNTCFENSALRTIKRWRFDPKTVAGAARLDVGKTATLNFRQ